MEEDKLKSFVERIEKLDEEKRAIQSDIKDVYNEAESTGFDKKALRALIKIRAQDADERKQLEGILEAYKNALGID